MRFLALLISILVTLIPPFATAAKLCKLQNHMNQKRCQALSKIGCPVRFLGAGCQKGDGGCQATNVCPQCCRENCLLSGDSRCRWTGTNCIRCPVDGPVDNGLPALPGGRAFVPSDWQIYGLGDSFSTFEQCIDNAEFVTGVFIWLSETDASKRRSVQSSLPSRLVMLDKVTGFLITDWYGNCTATKYSSYKYKPGVFSFFCDKSNIT